MCHVEFAQEAEVDLDRLDKTIAQRVLKKLRWLAENFESIRPEPLTGQWQGMFKLRVGDYRALYTLKGDEQITIIVHLIKHRREVYKIK
jgi:mRNA interferase RelE/StbE